MVRIRAYASAAVDRQQAGTAGLLTSQHQVHRHKNGAASDASTASQRQAEHNHRHQREIYFVKGQEACLARQLGTRGLLGSCRDMCGPFACNTCCHMAGGRTWEGWFGGPSQLPAPQTSFGLQLAAGQTRLLGVQASSGWPAAQHTHAHHLQCYQPPCATSRRLGHSHSAEQQHVRVKKGAAGPAWDNVPIAGAPKLRNSAELL